MRVIQLKNKNLKTKNIDKYLYKNIKNIGRYVLFHLKKLILLL